MTTRVWAFLVAVTVGAWLLTAEHDRHSLGASTALTVCVLVIAAVKVALVMSRFMEVRTAPRWLRLVCGGWLVSVFTLLGVLYLAG